MFIVFSKNTWFVVARVVLGQLKKIACCMGLAAWIESAAVSLNTSHRLDVVAPSDSVRASSYD